MLCRDLGILMVISLHELTKKTYHAHPFVESELVFLKYSIRHLHGIDRSN